MAPPRSLIDALNSLDWNLTNPAPMQYKSVEEMQALRGDASVNVSEFIRILAEKATIRNSHTKYMAQVATSLLLLGNGYTDEAHNLVLSLSWRGELPYAYGPSINVEDDEHLQTLACYAHSLVHRLEGPHESEFGMTGFQNSDFWSGNTMRYQEGVEGLLPLAQIRQGVIDLVNSEEAQEFVEKKLNGAFGIWDPRLLTELCSQVNEREEHDPLKQFAQKAALLELKLILRHILTTMGIDVSTENNRPKAERA